jgi:hypothetical protein
MFAVIRGELCGFLLNLQPGGVSIPKLIPQMAIIGSGRNLRSPHLSSVIRGQDRRPHQAGGMGSGVSFGELVLSCQASMRPEGGIISRAEALVATSDFSGLTGCAWALASAAAKVPILSLERR